MRCSRDCGAEALRHWLYAATRIRALNTELMFTKNKQHFPRPHLWLIALIGVIVPRRLRLDWRQEWEAELRYRERLLAEWDKLGWRNKLELLRRSASAFWDALWLQPERWEDEMIQDLRYGVRMLLKHPGFTVVSALTLALGIGVNTGLFTLFNAIVLRPLPIKGADRIVKIYRKDLEKSPRAMNNDEMSSPGEAHSS